MKFVLWPDGYKKKFEDTSFWSSLHLTGEGDNFHSLLHKDINKE